MHASSYSIAVELKGNVKESIILSTVSAKLQFQIYLGDLPPVFMFYAIQLISVDCLFKVKKMSDTLSLVSVTCEFGRILIERA